MYSKLSALDDQSLLNSLATSYDGGDVDPVSQLEAWRTKIPRISPFESALANLPAPPLGPYKSCADCVLANADKAEAAGNTAVADWLRKEASEGETHSAKALRILALGIVEAMSRGSPRIGRR